MVKKNIIIITGIIIVILMGIFLFTFFQSFSTTRVCESTCTAFSLGSECNPCNSGETISNIRVSAVGQSANFFSSVSAYCSQPFRTDTYSKFATCSIDDSTDEECSEFPDFPKYCSATDTCVKNTIDCEERCCIGGGCDSWDDWWFCEQGAIANCDVDTSFANNMVCCPNDFPVWNEKAQSCWKSSWECTTNTDCSGEAQCIGNICKDSGQQPGITIDVVGEASQESQIEYRIVSTPTDAEVFFGFNFENKLGETNYPPSGSFSSLSGSASGKEIFKVSKEGYNSIQFAIPESNIGKKIVISIVLEEISCASQLTYDPLVHEELVQISDCNAWVYLEDCPGGQWFVYHFLEPEISNMIMTNEQFKQVAPIECWQGEEPECTSDNDCPEDIIIPGTEVCTDDILSAEVTQQFCDLSINECSTFQDITIIDACLFGCENGACLEDPSSPPSGGGVDSTILKNILGFVFGGIAILFIVIIFIMIFRRNKR